MQRDWPNAPPATCRKARCESAPHGERCNTLERRYCAVFCWLAPERCSRNPSFPRGTRDFLSRIRLVQVVQTATDIHNGRNDMYGRDIVPGVWPPPFNREVFNEVIKGVGSGAIIAEARATLLLHYYSENKPIAEWPEEILPKRGLATIPPAGFLGGVNQIVESYYARLISKEREEKCNSKLS